MIAGIPFIISIIITLILMLISKKKLEYVNEVSKLNWNNILSRIL